MRRLLTLLLLCSALGSTSARADAGGSANVNYLGATVVDLNLFDGQAASYVLSPGADLSSFFNGISENGHGELTGTLNPFSELDITFDYAYKLWYTDVAGALSWLQLEAGGFTDPFVGGGIGIGVYDAIGAGWDYRHYDGSYHEKTFSSGSNLKVANPYDMPIAFTLYWGGTLTTYGGDPTQPEPPSIPEPQTYALLLAGLLLVALLSFNRNNRLLQRMNWLVVRRLKGPIDQGHAAVIGFDLHEVIAGRSHGHREDDRS